MIGRTFISLFVAIGFASSGSLGAQLSFTDASQSVQPKIAKIYGAGGIRGLEAYQSGFVISAEGHILTVFSYVLDTDYITVTLDDGSRHEAAIVGSDPRLELAVLKIDAQQLEHFNLDKAVPLSPGNRVLAFSNLFGIATGNEQASIQHGHVSAVWQLAARRGNFESPYKGPVYVLDAMSNNPGAAGGALTDQFGHLAGVLGKELRSTSSNIWLNYAIPIAEVKSSVQRILTGTKQVADGNTTDQVIDRPWTMPLIGMRLVPNLMSKTPPFVDSILSGTAADEAGLRPDDLVVYIHGEVIRSQTQLYQILKTVDQGDPLSVVVLRDNELKTFSLDALR